MRRFLPYFAAAALLAGCGQAEYPVSRQQLPVSGQQLIVRSYDDHGYRHAQYADASREISCTFVRRSDWFSAAEDSIEDIEEISVGDGDWYVFAMRGSPRFASLLAGNSSRCLELKHRIDRLLAEKGIELHNNTIAKVMDE